jgi:hypothetical protein
MNTALNLIKLPGINGQDKNSNTGLAEMRWGSLHL